MKTATQILRVSILNRGHVQLYLFGMVQGWPPLWLAPIVWDAVLVDPSSGKTILKGTSSEKRYLQNSSSLSKKNQYTIFWLRIMNRQVAHMQTIAGTVSGKIVQSVNKHQTNPDTTAFRGSGSTLVTDNKF